MFSIFNTKEVLLSADTNLCILHGENSANTSIDMEMYIHTYRNVPLKKIKIIQLLCNCCTSFHSRTAFPNYGILT